MAITQEASLPNDKEWHNAFDLVNITAESGKTYTVQTIGSVLAKEGLSGNGSFRMRGFREFQFSYNSENLYIKAEYNPAIVVISG